MKRFCVGIFLFAALGIAAPAICSTTIAPTKSTPATKEPVSPAKNPFRNGHFVLTADMHMNGYRSDCPTVLIVDKGSHSTYVLQLQKIGDKEEVVRVTTVSNAIGNVDKPTPSGRYWVARKQMYPEWIPPKTIDPDQKHIPPYNQTHKNPLGVAALFLNTDELALHGTNEPKAIRKSISHGCIRHSNADIVRLYDMVKVGTPVYIVREFTGTVLKSSDFKVSSSTHSHRSKAN